MSTKGKETIKDQAIKVEAKDFLSRSGKYKKLRSFHHTLRHEILFALVPRTLESCLEQRATLQEIALLLTQKRFLHDQGLQQFGKILKFSEIIGKPLKFEFRDPLIEHFCGNGKILFNNCSLLKSKVYNTGPLYWFKMVNTLFASLSTLRMERVMN